MPPQVRRVDGNHDEMARSRPNRVPACRTSVGLDGPIRVDDANVDLDPQIWVNGSADGHSKAQSTSAKVTARATATRT
jgi:hypothetical protein